MDNANLQKSILNLADLRGASLKDVILQGAYTGKAKLDNDAIEYAKEQGAQFIMYKGKECCDE